MAGIGYKLRAIVKDDTYTNLVKGYFYSAVISSGPWLFTVLCLLLLPLTVKTIAVFVGQPIAKADLNLFRITVIYTFSFSLILTGFVQMVVARYLSDILYSGATKRIVPSFVTILAVIGALAFFIAIGFYAFADQTVPFGFRITAAALFATICCIWVAMIFLGAARDYNSIFLGFGVGTLVSLVAAGWLGAAYGPAGLLFGFTAGQILVLAILTARALSEFDGPVTFSREVLRHFNLFPMLALIGFFYNLGIWVDKFFFMFGPSGTQVSGPFFANPSYTTPIFFAYLTIVPTLSLLVIRVETSFHDVYRKYFGTIVGKRPLHEIERVRREMVDNLKLSTSRILKMQGVVSLLAIVFAEPIADAIGMNATFIPVFRIAVLASLLQAMLLVLIIMLLYLDQRKKVLTLSVLFFLSNGALTAYFSVVEGPMFDGYGYAAAGLLCVVVGYLMLEAAVKQLTFHTFMRQPVSSSTPS